MSKEKRKGKEISRQRIYCKKDGIPVQENGTETVTFPKWVLRAVEVDSQHQDVIYHFETTMTEVDPEDLQFAIANALEEEFERKWLQGDKDPEAELSGIF